MQGARLNYTPDGFPDLASFGRELSPRSPEHRAFKQLHAALQRCDPSAPLVSRVAGLEALFGWLASRRSVPALAEAQREPAHVTRLRWLLLAVDKLPSVRVRLSAAVASVLSESAGGGLFGRLGLPTDRGFLAETIDRISRGLLPEPLDERDLAQLLGKLFPDAKALRALEATPPELFAELVRAL